MVKPTYKQQVAKAASQPGPRASSPASFSTPSTPVVNSRKGVGRARDIKRKGRHTNKKRGRPRHNTGRQEYFRKYNECRHRVDISDAVYQSLATFTKQVQKCSISEGIEEAIKLYKVHRASKSDVARLSNLPRAAVVTDRPEEQVPAEPHTTAPAKDWSTASQVITRYLQSEGAISDQKMPVVLALSQLLWQGTCDVGNIPSTQQFRDWASALDMVDREKFTEVTDEVAALHLLTDASKEHANKRYALLCSYWDKANGKPAVHALATFNLARETAQCFVEDIAQVLDRSDIFPNLVRTVMGDFAAVNLGAANGIALLSQNNWRQMPS